MRLYFDTAYVGKCYLSEPDGPAVRDLARSASGLATSAWCRAELASVFHRHYREGTLTRSQVPLLMGIFDEDVDRGVWDLIPLTDDLLRNVAARIARLPRSVYIRGGDAVHLASAAVAAFAEIWTNDRQMLAAAPHFGLVGRTLVR